MYTEDNLNAVKTIILQEMTDVEIIWLFGSYAKNKANQNSDLDIAIVVSNKKDWRKRKCIMTNLYRKTSGIGLMVDFLLKDIASFEKEKRLPTISRIVEREGRIIWTKN
ncbi:MAG: nucleotidyltransferase domain-containing protein [Candidatus Cloacimonetes bacterium]|nr:nucleotidyltransferase domain-containing protein [Candidatus Cloacimonadota bacterium]